MPRPAKPTVHPSMQEVADSVIEHRLSNGLQVRLIPYPSVPTLSCYTFFRVGSRNERPGITGISHLFEHMMFNGAKKYGPGEFDRVLEGSGGSSNAYTSTDLTVYYEDCTADALDVVLDLESDRMRSLMVTPKMLESERQVVLEERRLRVDNEIAGMLDEELSTLVWKAHPYRWPVIGWQRDIEAISRDACLEYFSTYYAPNNATLFIAGDFDPDEALALVKKRYGNIRPGPKPLPVLDAEPEQKGERRAEIHHPAQAPSLMSAWRGPRATDPDTLTLDLLQYVLSVGQSSRLVKRLVFEQEAAVSISVDWTWRVDPGAFVISLELANGADPRRAEEALDAELQQIREKGIDARELEKAKNNLFVHQLRELSTHSGRAHALGTYEMFLGHWREGLALPARYQAITVDDVHAAARKYLAPTQRSVVTLRPTEVAS